MSGGLWACQTADVCDRFALGAGDRSAVQIIDFNRNLQTLFLFPASLTFFILFLQRGGIAAHVADHVSDHASHTIVKRAIEDLLASPLRLHEPGGLQKPQVMTYQCRREPDTLRNVRHA